MPTPNEAIIESLKEVKQTLREAPALNGGFDKLSATVEYIALKQKENSEQLDKIESHLYVPDNGLFARVKSIENSDKFNINEIKAQAEAMSDVSEQVEKLEKTTEKIAQIGGEDLTKLKDVVSFHESFKKFYWLLIAAIMSPLAKLLFDIISKKVG